MLSSHLVNALVIIACVRQHIDLRVLMQSVFQYK